MIDLASLKDRLRAARKAAGLSREAAGQRMGQAATTVASHENGQTPIPPLEKLVEYAALYGKSMEFILTGRDAEAAWSSRVRFPIDGVVNAGPIVEPVGETTLQFGSMPLPAEGHLAGLIVSGWSQLPRWRDGEVIVYDRRSVPLEDLLGSYAVLVDVNGDRFVKVLGKGQGANRWRMDSHNAPTVEDAELIGGHRIVATVHRRPGAPDEDMLAPSFSRRMPRRPTRR